MELCHNNRETVRTDLVFLVQTKVSWRIMFIIRYSRQL